MEVLKQKNSDLERTISETAGADRQQLAELQRLFRDTESELQRVSSQLAGALVLDLQGYRRGLIR